MIAVVGWPRSGTSLLMQVLAAGGMTAIVDRGALRPRPGNLGGVWEVRGLTSDPRGVLGEKLADPNAHVKLLHRHLHLALELGLLPSAVVMTRRPIEQVVASWGRLWPGATIDPAVLERVRGRSLELLRERDVATLEVDVPALVAEPRASCESIAGFLAAHVEVKLDVDAMTAVPDPDRLHG